MVRAGNMSITMMAAVVDCQVCPFGTNCEQGSTLEALPIVRGFYRVGNDTTDVRKCPDSDANCSSTGNGACVSTSGCIGGTNSEALCATGLSGIFCRTCLQEEAGSPTYYIKGDEAQEASCKECGNNLTITFLLGIAFLCGLGVAAALLAWLKRKPSFVHAMEVFTPQNKSKILIGFYMIVTKIDTIYDVVLPGDVRAVLRTLSSVFTLGMQGVATTPLACLGFQGYVPELLFWIVFPMVVVVVVLMFVLLSNALRRKPTAATGVQQSGSLKRKQTSVHMGAQLVSLQDQPTIVQREATILEKALPPVLQIMFFLYPLVTTAAFEGFPCYEFADGRGWLIADVSIECRTADHASATALAWIAVFICMHH